MEPQPQMLQREYTIRVHTILAHTPQLLFAELCIRRTTALDIQLHSSLLYSFFSPANSACWYKKNGIPTGKRANEMNVNHSTLWNSTRFLFSRAVSAWSPSG